VAHIAAEGHTEAAAHTGVAAAAHTGVAAAVHTGVAAAVHTGVEAAGMDTGLWGNSTATPEGGQGTPLYSHIHFACLGCI
jgi:hypothetical protein